MLEDRRTEAPSEQRTPSIVAKQNAVQASPINAPRRLRMDVHAEGTRRLVQMRRSSGRGPW